MIDCPNVSDMTAIERPLSFFEQQQHHHHTPLLDLDLSSWSAKPSSAPLAAVVAEILGKHVDLKLLQRSGAEGQSGCQVYFAQRDHETIAVVKVFPPTCHKGLIEELLSYKKLLSIPEAPRAARPLGVQWTRHGSTDLSGVIVYQVAPGKAVNTMLREVGCISTLRSIAKAAALDNGRKDELENFIRLNRSKIPLDWHLHDQMEIQEPDAYSENLSAYIETVFRQLMNDLRCAVRAVASTLAKLHMSTMGQWNQSSEAAVSTIRLKLDIWMQEILGSSETDYQKAGICLERLHEMNDMVQHVIKASRQEGVASLLHGDASTGNFFWHPTHGITMIDYGALCHSMDESGQPIGYAESDTAGFYERLRKYAAGFGVSESDVSAIQNEFWEAYSACGVPLSNGIVRLCRIRVQMSRLWSAVQKLNSTPDSSNPERNKFRSAVEFEWERLRTISNLHETTRIRRILIVANASGPGKGGLPTLNQELVKAMSELENTAVTLFMVSPPNVTQHDLQKAHGQAEVFTVPAQPDCAPSELLYYAAKIHQPQEFGLPSPEQRDALTSKFDLIIGHCRYSSAAAKLVRDRWYPRAKLAIMTHTSPLRKSDAAWIWYGETREQGYVEAARLAILDEKVLPNADLAIGVGPVLTAEAREREWIGSLSQHRASDSGPRFHEFIPGVYVDNVLRRTRRQPNDGFRVLLAGRADDPAKGVEDAIYAVMKIAATGADIVLDILGMHAEFVEEKQRQIDEITQREGLVRVHSFSDDPFLVRGFYQTADLVIMPSTHEGFGMIFTEAAGFGIPVLATQDSGAAQFVLDRQRVPVDLGGSCVVMDESAYGVAPSATSERVALWADRINQVRLDPEKALRQAQELRETLRGYTWKQSAEALLRSALECSDDDTVQMAHGVISRSRHLAPEVVESMSRSSKTRNASGVPEKALADEVLQSLPEIEPTSSALEQFTSVALDHAVILKPLGDSHPKGYSGAPIFFAYSKDIDETGSLAKSSPNSEAEKALAVVKLFTHGLDNGITDELSSLEWLFRRAQGEIATPIPIAVCRMTWEGKQAGVIVYTVASGQSLAQLMMKIGKMTPGVGRQHMLGMLKAGSRGAARTLIKLHAYGVEGRSSRAYLEWYYQAARDRANRLVQYGDALEKAGIQVDEIVRRSRELISQSQQEIVEQPQTTVVHGDAHPANFFHDSATDSITMIDVTTLHCSLDENGTGVGTPERDIGHFVHMLRRTGEQFGMREDEMNECAETFMDAYCQEGSLRLKMGTLRLLVVCSAMSFLVYAARDSQVAGNTTTLQQQAKILEDMFRV